MEGTIYKINANACRVSLRLCASLSFLCVKNFCFPLFAVFLFFTPLCWGNLAQETIYLTWLQNPSTTMTIQWISPAQEKESIAFFRPVNGTEWIKIVGESFAFPQSPKYLIHRLEIKNLKAGSEYRFKIAPSDKEYQFATAPSSLVNELRFVVGGDMYHDAIRFMAKTCQRAAETNPLFAVIGGDIAYAVKSHMAPNQDNERWIEWIKTWHAAMVTPRGNMIPVIAAVGNHDVIGQYDQTPLQAAVFSLLFPMPGKRIFNVLDFDSYLSIILLDSGHANPISGEQTKWLNGTLEARQEVINRFAVYHVPAYPCVRNFNTRQSDLIRQWWVPLFEKWGVQAVFEHHDHAYKRTHPLLKNRIHPQGIVYLGDGGWGVEEPRKLKSKRPFLAKFVSARHFILVTLTPTQQRFKSINDQGQMIDEWTKTLAKPPSEVLVPALRGCSQTANDLDSSSFP